MNPSYRQNTGMNVHHISRGTSRTVLGKEVIAVLLYKPDILVCERGVWWVYQLVDVCLHVM